MINAAGGQKRKAGAPLVEEGGHVAGSVVSGLETAATKALHSADTPAATGASRTPLGPRTTPPPRSKHPLTHALAAELEALTRKLVHPGELTDAELSAVRSQLTGLDKSQLQHARKVVDRRLAAWRKVRVKKAHALEGPATVDKVMVLLGGPGRLGRMPSAKKAELRRVRDANVDALLSRAGLRLVNGNEGLFRRLNPGDATHPEGFRVGLDGKAADSIDQRYALLDAVSDMLRVGYSELEINDRVLAAVAKDAPRPDANEHEHADHNVNAALAEMTALVSKRSRSFEVMPAAKTVGAEAKAELAKRLSDVRWLEATVAGESDAWKNEAPAAYREDLAAIFALAGRDAMEEVLDARFERVMDFALGSQLRAEGLEPLATVRVERLPAERLDHRPDAARRELPKDHAVRRHLLALADRLDAGEQSAVGAAYAKQTFPEEVLESVAKGELKVVAFDGSRENGVRYIRDKYGVNDALLRSSCRLMGLQGVYGSYPRTLVTLDDGQQFLLLTGYGSARQLNNAGALLLYTSKDGARAPVDNIELAHDGTDFTATVREDLRDAILSDWAGRDGAPDELPTRLIILQNPVHLERLLGESLEWSKVPEGTLVPFFLGYRTHEDGHRERIVIPKVGGGGVYGDTAGQFMTAFFTSGFENLIPDVIFNGTAGGFANTLGTPGFENYPGLPDVEPGGAFMPTQQVEQFGDPRGPIDIPSLFGKDVAAWPEDVIAKAKAAGVHFTGKHVAIPAPAIETHALIQELVQQGFGSIDVEGASIMEAARKLGKTCTAVYTHSDDPRASRDDPNASLGMVGPFLEGSRYHQALFEFIDVLWTHSDAKLKRA